MSSASSFFMKSSNCSGHWETIELTTSSCRHIWFPPIPRNAGAGTFHNALMVSTGENNAGNLDSITSQWPFVRLFDCLFVCLFVHFYHACHSSFERRVEQQQRCARPPAIMMGRVQGGLSLAMMCVDWSMDDVRSVCPRSVRQNEDRSLRLKRHALILSKEETAIRVETKKQRLPHFGSRTVKHAWLSEHCLRCSRVVGMGLCHNAVALLEF